MAPSAWVDGERAQLSGGRSRCAGTVTQDTPPPSEPRGIFEPQSSFPTAEIVEERTGGPWGLEVGSPTTCQVLPLEEGDTVVIGSSRRADVRVEDPTVSAVHARLHATESGVRVEDLGSKNGVYLSGARIGSAWLTVGETSVVLGRTALTLRSLATFGAESIDGEPVPGIVGDSIPMRRLAAEIRRIAPLRAPVLIQGESGSGKDLVARAIHTLSGRRGDYVPLNVGAITETLADAELFGHCRGAFTGAVASRAGAFEVANRGTLFLDEIADLPPSIQVKLLRVVEERRVRPVGSSRSEEVDVRVLSAAWARLEERVAKGAFREDLYHRIATFVIRVPPLRARRSDIPALSRILLRRLGEELGPKELGSRSLAMLVGHSWPGNVRELASVLYRAAAAAPGEFIDVAHVASALTLAKKRPRPLSVDQARALLSSHGDNVSAAARAAAVPRSTFRSWLAGRDCGEEGRAGPSEGGGDAEPTQGG